MTSSIIKTDESPQDEKRHPWRCYRKLDANGAQRCCTLNRASDSHCRGCGHPYWVESRSKVETGSQLAARISINEALAEYEQYEQRIRNLFCELTTIEQDLGLLFHNQRYADSIERVNLNGGAHFDISNVDRVIEHAEREIWKALYARSGVGRITSSKRAKEMETLLRDGELPKLNRENFERWLVNISGGADELFREKVAEVFEWLRPWSDTHKTNSKFEIGKKVVLEYVVERANANFGWHPEVKIERRQILSSLETVFKALDGKGHTTNGWTSELKAAIETANPEDPRFETEYFSGKTYRNGNMHLEFKRPDLVARLNSLAGGRNLRGSHAA